MSMTGRYHRVTPQQLAALRADPSAFPDFVYPKNGTEPSADRRLDIDKAWHAVHFLLNGDPWEGRRPLVDAVLGGTELGQRNFVYGPPRYLTPDEVHGVAEALDAVPTFELLDRFDAQALNDAEVYPHGWSGSAEERNWIERSYLELTQFFRRAAEAGDAMVLYLA